MRHTPLLLVCQVDVDIVTDYPPYLIEGVNSTATVCLLIDSTPGPFETPITIPIIIKELIPKPYYYKGGSFGGGKGGGFGGGKGSKYGKFRATPASKSCT